MRPGRRVSSVPSITFASNLSPEGLMLVMRPFSVVTGTDGEAPVERAAVENEGFGDYSFIHDSEYEMMRETEEAQGNLRSQNNDKSWWP
jgi:hypothetical protein